MILQTSYEYLTHILWSTKWILYAHFAIILGSFYNCILTILWWFYKQSLNILRTSYKHRMLIFTDILETFNNHSFYNLIWLICDDSTNILWVSYAHLMINKMNIVCSFSITLGSFYNCILTILWYFYKHCMNMLRASYEHQMLILQMS